jgi:hypothetical protein
LQFNGRLFYDAVSIVANKMDIRRNCKMQTIAAFKSTALFRKLLENKKQRHPYY